MMRHPFQLYINFLKLCNLQCIHCYSNSGNSKEVIDIKKLTELVNEIKPLKIIISGGEPLLMYKKIKLFLEGIKEKTYITILTNGTIFDKNVSNFLSEYANEVVVSLDSLDPEIFKKIRGKDLLLSVINNIKEINKLNKKLSLSYTIFDANFFEIDKILSFASSENIKWVNILRAREIGRQKGSFTKQKILENYKNAITQSEEKGIHLEIHDPLVNELNLKDYKTECYAGEFIISINTDLSFKPCPFSIQSFKGTFLEVWNDPKFQNLKLSCMRHFKE